MKDGRNHQNDCDQQSHIGPVDAILGGHDTCPLRTHAFSRTLLRIAESAQASTESATNQAKASSRVLKISMSRQATLPSLGCHDSLKRGFAIPLFPNHVIRADGGRAFSSPASHVADLSTTRLLPRAPLFQYSCSVYIIASAKYQDFAVLLANRFDAIHIFWPGMERQDHVVRKHAASPRI